MHSYKLISTLLAGVISMPAFTVAYADDISTSTAASPVTSVSSAKKALRHMALPALPVVCNADLCAGRGLDRHFSLGERFLTIGDVSTGSGQQAAK
jgi:hypothetical protein